MQTFLPKPDFVESAKCLDRQRLGKQRVEAKQILLANLQGPTIFYDIIGKKYLFGVEIRNRNRSDHREERKTPWYNHPAVRMWRGYDKALCLYGMCICQEWIKRGYRDSLYDWFYTRLMNLPGTDNFPDWIGSDEVHTSHRARLLYKNPEWYCQFGWTEKPRGDSDGYMWPT